jgi:hypothetical protein
MRFLHFEIKTGPSNQVKQTEKIPSTRRNILRSSQAIRYRYIFSSTVGFNLKTIVILLDRPNSYPRSRTSQWAVGVDGCSATDVTNAGLGMDPG